ncbi:hypothetical protein [Lysinibacter cavernae]|uniref:YcxB family protein n=1 Tax=Lysinibacter cavernae TaxID=1640652 RepID=A0A7X5R137_9MICO|nr:hypothetical protein [Lysinibacter cavernae]NIH53651.1 hypothetical protein [Lysinibacter cavernae]
MNDQTIFYNETRPSWSDAIAVSRLGSGFRSLILVSIIAGCIAIFALLLPLAADRPLTASSFAVPGFIALILLILWGAVIVKLRMAAKRYESQPAGVWRVTGTQVQFTQGGTSITFTLSEMTTMAVFRGFVLASFNRGQYAAIPESGLVRAIDGQPAAPGELASMFRRFAPEVPPKAVLRAVKGQ